jgi:hypothetical protein
VFLVALPLWGTVSDRGSTAPGVFPFYATALMLVCGGTLLTLSETKGIDLHEGDREHAALRG